MRTVRLFPDHDDEPARGRDPTRAKRWRALVTSNRVQAVSGVAMLALTVAAAGPQGFTRWEGSVCRREPSIPAIDCGRVTGHAVVNGELRERDQLVLTQQSAAYTPIGAWRKAKIPYVGICRAAGLVIRNMRSGAAALSLQALGGGSPSFAMVESGAATSLSPGPGWSFIVDANTGRIFAAIAASECTGNGLMQEGDLDHGHVRLHHTWRTS